MAYPKYSILITVAGDGTTVVTQYTSKVTAKAAQASALASGLDSYLYLEPQPSRSLVAQKSTGHWIDAYGDYRLIPSGVID
jgi:hypothetical protein